MSVSSVGSGTSKQSTREVQRTVYVVENEHYRNLFSRKLRLEEKEAIIKNFTKGTAKITWDHPTAKRDRLIAAIENNIISLDRITVHMVKKEE